MLEGFELLCNPHNSAAAAAALAKSQQLLPRHIFSYPDICVCVERSRYGVLTDT